MKKINLLFEKLDKFVLCKNLKNKFLKLLKIGFVGFSGLSIIAIFSFLIYAKFIPGIGTSGTYVCNYLDDNNDEFIYSKLVVQQDNKCTLFTYVDNDKVLANPIVKDYYWAVHYAYNPPENYDKRIPFSNFQFSFENASGGSMFQYYFFPDKKIMITKVYSPLFNDGLVVLKKI